MYPQYEAPTDVGKFLSVITSAALATAALVVGIGGVAKARAALLVGVRLKLAPEPTLNPPPGVQVVALDDGKVVQLPAVATDDTAFIAPALVVTFSTGLVVQPEPLHVMVPEAPTKSEPPALTAALATVELMRLLSSSWGQPMSILIVIDAPFE